MLRSSFHPSWFSPCRSPTMSQQVRKASVKLTVKEPVELAPGVVLPTGEYDGERKQIGVLILGGRVQWTNPEYMIELTRDPRYDPPPKWRSAREGAGLTAKRIERPST